MPGGLSDPRRWLRSRPGDQAQEVAAIALGTAESRGEGYEARAQAVAGLCRLADADEDLIPGWIEESRRRAEAAKHAPFSGGVRP